VPLVQLVHKVTKEQPDQVLLVYKEQQVLRAQLVRKVPRVLVPQEPQDLRVLLDSKDKLVPLVLRELLALVLQVFRVLTDKQVLLVPLARQVTLVLRVLVPQVRQVQLVPQVPQALTVLTEPLVLLARQVLQV
jgi:hypothetical protein